jgi:hypothetical protein
LAVSGLSAGRKGGKAVADCLIAEKLFERACGYEWVEERVITVKEIIYGDYGKKLKETEEVRVVEVRKRLPPDTAAAFFWLKNRQPEVWATIGSRPRPRTAWSMTKRLCSTMRRWPSAMTGALSRPRARRYTKSAAA